jgi:hypothetical protein
MIRFLFKESMIVICCCCFFVSFCLTVPEMAIGWLFLYVARYDMI